MKKLLFILLFLPIFSFGQLKVAILDFENTSGIAKYDGLGKAMSNMLITDLTNNIHPRKVIFMERSQLNKILDEQNLQKSKKFDNKTAVDFGKLSGVDFVIIGSVYVLDNICNISSRMVNVETSEIEYSKEANGAISDWIKLKSDLAIEFANIVNNPISIENSDQTTSEGVLVQYAKIIEAIDQENIDLAEGMIQMMKDLQVDFNYLDFLTEDIQKIKERL
jgi:curli biogenesis system outer membrane secretion channel CsgG